MASKKTTRMILTAVMAALCFVATRIIQLPTPTGGYIHLGDGFVLIAGMVLGPIYGFLAAGIGSMFVDLLSGYTQYALVTFVIKGIVACITGLIAKKLMYRKKGTILTSIFAGMLGTLIVMLGYWSFEAYILGYGCGPALIGMPTNFVQGVFGIIVSATFVPAFDRIAIVKELRFGNPATVKHNTTNSNK